MIQQNQPQVTVTMSVTEWHRVCDVLAEAPFKAVATPISKIAAALEEAGRTAAVQPPKNEAA